MGKFLYAFLICVSLFFRASAVDLENSEDGLLPDEDIIFVSLGAHCQSATQLNHANLRKKAFPFDWLITNCHPEFIKLLEDDFEFFLDDNYLLQNSKAKWRFNNFLYKVEFRHETEEKIRKINKKVFLEVVKDARVRYERRIARFRELKNYSGKVFFIRSASIMEDGFYWFKECHPFITSLQAEELKEALRQYFPDLNFTLVIINYENTNAPNIPWKDDIIEFKVSSSDTFIYDSFTAVITTLKELANIKN